MSVTSTTNRNSYTGNGTANTYAYSFKIFDEDHLVVTVQDDSTPPVETTLTKTTDYTVTGVGSTSGGNVVLVDAAQAWLDGDGDLLTDYVITIRRVVPLTQTTDIRNQGDFYPEVHEDRFDKLVMADQQQQDEVDRSVKLPESITPSAFDPTLPTDVGTVSKSIVTNPAGDGLVMGPTVDEISNAQTYAQNASDSADEAEEWATKTDGIVEATDYSSKAWSIGGTDVTETAARGAAKEWATKTDNPVDTSEYSAKEHAQGTQTRGTSGGGSAKDWAQYLGGTVDDTEYSSKKYANDAAASAAAAATSAGSSLWNDVVYKVFGDSPIAVVDGDAGTMFAVDCSGGNVVINLPSIAALTLSGSWSIGVKKTDTSSNTITINRDGTDTIDGGTSLVISRAEAGTTLIPDADGSPDDWTSLTYGEVPISGDIVGTTDTQDLSNKTFTDPVTLEEQGSSPSTPASGDRKLYAKTDGKMYHMGSDGVETAVGSGAGGGINYHDDYECDNINKVDTYDDGGTTEPVDGTGDAGSKATTASLNTSSPISGTSSYQLEKPASDVQGQGWSIDSDTLATLETDGSEAVWFNFSYTTPGAYASGDYTVWVYRVGSNTLEALNTFQGSSFTNDLPAAPNGGRYSGWVTPSSSDTELRLIIHVGTTSTTAMNMQMDRVSIGPAGQVQSAIISDPVAFTPTGTWTTNATYTGFWTRYGKWMELDIKIALSGAPNSANLSVNLPSGYTIDSSAWTIGSGGGAAQEVGLASLNANGATYNVSVYVNSTTQLGVYDRTANTTYVKPTAYVTDTVPDTFISGSVVYVKARVPISGWSSGNAMSTAELSVRGVHALVGKNSGSHTSSSNWQDITSYDSEIKDTHNAFASGVFTCPHAGVYSVKGMTGFSATTNIVRSRVAHYDGATTTYYYGAANDNQTGGGYPGSGLSVDIYCGKGDTLTLGAYQASGGSLAFDINAWATYFSIKDNPDLAVIGLFGAGKSVVVHANNSSGQSIANATETTVTNWIKKDDNFNAFNATTGVFTAPKKGAYTFTFHWLFSATMTIRTLGHVAHYQSDGSTLIDDSVAFGFVANGENFGIITATYNLEQGEIVKPRIYHNEGVNKTLYSASGIYTTFSVHGTE